MKHLMGADTRFIWHKETSLEGVDLLLIPGGFSYGDYLRTGAIARFSPVMQEVMTFAEEGRPVLGICNGFQILLEAGLLPGAMLHNEKLRFVCKNVFIRVENSNSPYTAGLEEGRSEEHTSELQSRGHLVCRLLLEKKNKETFSRF